MGSEESRHRDWQDGDYEQEPLRALDPAGPLSLWLGGSLGLVQQYTAQKMSHVTHFVDAHDNVKQTY